MTLRLEDDQSLLTIRQKGQLSSAPTDLMKYAAGMLKKIRKDSKKIADKVMNGDIVVRNSVKPPFDAGIENEIEPANDNEHFEFHGSQRKPSKYRNMVTKRAARMTTRPHESPFAPWNVFDEMCPPFNDITDQDGTAMNKRVRRD